MHNLIRSVTGFILILLALAVTCSAALPFTPGVLNWSNVEPSKVALLTEDIGQVSLMKVKKAEGNGSSDIYLVINSDGGSLYYGQIILNHLRAIRAGGNKVRCAVTDRAFSMAFWILIECDERYVLPYASLMFHGARRQSAMLDSELCPAAQELKLSQEFIKRRAQEELKLSPEQYEYYSSNEFYWVGATFSEKFPGFLKVVDRVEYPTDPEAIDANNPLMQLLMQMQR